MKKMILTYLCLCSCCIPSSLLNLLTNENVQKVYDEIPFNNGDLYGTDAIDDNFIVPSPSNAIVYNSNLGKYFNNLTSNFPKNTNGSCGIVALSMILGFFDTYGHMNFIDNEYKSDIVEYPNDVQWNNITSRGLKNINHSDICWSYDDYVSNLPEDLTPVSFAEFAGEQYMLEYFDTYLMYLNYLLAGNEFNFSINEYAIERLINAYYSDYFSVEWYHPSVSTNTDLDYLISFYEQKTLQFREEIASIIEEEEFPVWVFAASDFELFTDKNGNIFYDNSAKHAIVAFDYFIENEKINLVSHFGYHNNSVYTYPDFTSYPNDEIEYKYIKGYAVLRPKYQPDNCVISYKIGNLNYCACGRHVHDLDYSYHNFVNHLVSCVCGLKYYENHNGDNCCENSSGGFNPVVPPGVIPGVI